jgi:hypothetical protein
MADYKYRVEFWDAAAARWVPDGAEALCSGITRRCENTAGELAERLLRNWTEEPASTVTGRWRATVWNWEPGRSVGEPAASAVVTRPECPGPEPEAGR